MRKLLVFLAAFLATAVYAQPYTGVHKFDGKHRNEVSAYGMFGGNIVSGTFGGLELSYKRYLGNRWSAAAAGQVQMGKQQYSGYVMGGYRLPVSWMDFYLDGKLMYNRYHRWNTDETVANLSLTWETPYVFLKVGESYIHYHVLDFGCTEPLTLTFGVGTSIRPRWNSWNIGLFFRNYDEFYYENWNINWGFNFYANLRPQMQLFGEFNVRPAGSMSQLASRYETSLKLGLKYNW